MRYLNPQRSKNLQDRKGWIEGWEPRIKADEFIHGFSIGEAYLRHNARPAKVKPSAPTSILPEISTYLKIFLALVRETSHR